MGKKSRRRARSGETGTTPPTTTRSYEDRFQQVATIRQRLLSEYQLDERVPSIATLFATMDRFVNEGVSASGTLPLHGSNKRIVYVLSNKTHVQCRVSLQVIERPRHGARALRKPVGKAATANGASRTRDGTDGGNVAPA